MSEKLKQQLIIAIKNSITLICFTTLSVWFDKWWIIFFSLLFLSYIERKEENTK